jgi:hypothetical protein
MHKDKDYVASPTPQAIPEHYEVELVRDARIPMADPSISLSAHLHLPVGAGQSP